MTTDNAIPTSVPLSADAIAATHILSILAWSPLNRFNFLFRKWTSLTSIAWAKIFPIPSSSLPGYNSVFIRIAIFYFDVFLLETPKLFSPFLFYVANVLRLPVFEGRKAYRLVSTELKLLT